MNQDPIPDRRPPAVVEAGFGRMFEDLLGLSDFIFQRCGISPNLKAIREMARAGMDGPNDDPTVWLHRFHRAMEDELREFKDSLAWKWWKPHVKTDLQNARVEIIDMFHFVVTMAVVAGLTGEDFTRVVYEKRALNFERQIQGFRRDDNLAVGRGIPGGVPRPPDVQGEANHREGHESH